MPPVDLLIYALATWRVSYMLVHERGPGDVFMHIREFCGITHDETGEKIIIPDGFFPGVFSCLWCCSVWIGLFFSLWALVGSVWAIWLAVPFALSAGAIGWEKMLDR